MHNIRELVLTCKLGKLSILTELFIYLIPRRFLALSHSKMTCRYGKDSTPSPQTLVRSTSSAHPTLTLAPLPSPTLLPQTTPQTYPAPLRAWLPPKPLWLRVGPGGGAVLILAPYQTHHSCLLQQGLHPLLLLLLAFAAVQPFQ